MNPVRTFAALTLLESFMIFASATAFIPGGSARLTARLRLNRRIARGLARAIGLRIESDSAPEIRKIRGNGRGRLVLANHTSVLDAIALAGLEDAIFITSRDMAESPAIRWLATIAGATFVERRNRDRRASELANLEAHLREGRTIVIFPEATSTNGGEILRFRNGLLDAARRVPGTEIVPVCLQYVSIGDRPVDSETRDRIFLYGEMSVLTHLVRIFTNPPVRLAVQYFRAFPARDFSTAAEIAAHAEFLIRSVYRPIR